MEVYVNGPETDFGACEERASRLLKVLERWHGAKKDKNSDGLSRLTNIVRAEQRWLHSNVTDAWLDSTANEEEKYGEVNSNLPYLEAVEKVAILERPVVGISLPFRYRPVAGDVLFSPYEASKKATVRVDVVSGGGRRWVKAVSRSLRSLRMELLRVEQPTTDAADGSEDLDMEVEDSTTFRDGLSFATDRLPFFSSAQSLLSAARQNPVGFKTPEVIYRFVNARRGEDPLVDTVYFDRLSAIGVHVETADQVSSNSNITAASSDIRQEYTENIYEQRLIRHDLKARKEVSEICESVALNTPTITPTLNLDVTTLLAMVSILSHSQPPIPAEVLPTEASRTQAGLEIKNRFFVSLLPLLYGRVLHATETAHRRLMDICNVVGGESESRRAVDLFSMEGMLLPRFLDPTIAGYSLANLPMKFPERVSVLIVPDIVSEAFVRFLNPKDRCHLAAPESTFLALQRYTAATINSERSNDGISGKFVPRMNLPNVIVFGSGYERRETTLSANGQIARSLASENGLQGVSIHIHETRILVEAKVPPQLGFS